MAQLTNKCTDDDVEYYIKECGDILGVSSQISNPDDPKAILNYIFQEIFKYKSSSLSWSAESEHAVDALSNVVFAAGKLVKLKGGAMGKRSDADSEVGSVNPANSALANSDMENAGMPDSDNSYAELKKLHWWYLYYIYKYWTFFSFSIL